MVVDISVMPVISSMVVDPQVILNDFPVCFGCCKELREVVHMIRKPRSTVGNTVTSHLEENDSPQFRLMSE